MTTYAILQDMSLCMECQACRIACQMQNNLEPDHAFVKFRFTEAGTYPSVTHHVARLCCFHCEEAACVQICPTGACYKGATGLTHFDADRCTGCAYCAECCPFEVPAVQGNRAFRCVGCEALTAGGKSPACVSTCMAGALSYGPREEMLARARERVSALKQLYPNAQVYSPEGVGHTNLIWALRDSPEAYGLPANPEVAASLGLWKDAVQPFGKLAMAATLVVGGFGFIIARRNHLREMREGDE